MIGVSRIVYYSIIDYLDDYWAIIIHHEKILEKGNKLGAKERFVLNSHRKFSLINYVS